MESRGDEAKFALTDNEIEQAFRGLARSFNPSAAHDAKFIVVERKGKKFVFCPLTKDAQTADNEAHLPYVIDMLLQFQKEFRGSNYHLLFPMRLCRGHLHLPISIPWIKNSHYILGVLEVDTLFLRFHDAQPGSNYSTYTYPDKFAELKMLNGRQLIYNKSLYSFYGKLVNNYYLAPYYVIEYAREMVTMGNSESCALFSMPCATMTNKQDYLSRYITAAAPPPIPAERLKSQPDNDPSSLSAHLSQSLFIARPQSTTDSLRMDGVSISV